MTLRKSYNEIMKKIEVTDAMRSRILQNIQTASPEKKPETIPFPGWKTLLAAAACFAVLLAGVSVFQGLNQPEAGPPVDVVANPFTGSVEFASAEELSEAVGFPVQDLVELPLKASVKTYCALFGTMAQIEYTDGENTVIYRKSMENGDNSGDYNTYDQVETVLVGTVTVTLKGSGGKYALALWQEGEFSHSISAAPGLSRQEMLRMIGG